ncbi:PQQ-dependent sugar dehydrogenase, partial [Serinibacter arcticus]|uniref:PQQ-dependent sugar dehydrogenase n=1 Tax=Serinibacter arcticus TaxID=1655435 RepID=UPI001091B066
MRSTLRTAVVAVAAGALLLPQAAFAAPGDAPGAAPAVAAADVTDEEALDWSNYERVLLTGDTGEPIGLKVMPDLTVLHTARDGIIRHTDPATGVTNVITDVPVYNNSEDGLQNLALDPDFENNGWVYLFYAPATMVNAEGENYPESTPEGSAPTVLPAGEDEATYWDQWRGYNQLTRVKWDFEARTLDMASEQVILKVGVERGQCCHVGGDIDFDLDGNVLVTTGDNTPAGTPGANGFAPNNDAPGMNPGLDARRGAGNSNDLRGAILRVTVAEDGSYTIPEGNLWEEGTELTRPEIYVGGLRNPFRMAVDPESGAVTWADYGPDAGDPIEARGPMGYVEWQSTTKALNGGWPYCHGPNANYNNWDFATATPGEFFDCETGAINDSRWNTGLEVLPPATAPQLYYGDNPGDQPFDELVEFSPNGGQGPMGGPVFRYDETIENPGQLPEYWDGKAFMYEFSQDYVAAISMEGLDTEAGPNWDGEVVEIENFMPNEALETNEQPSWSGPIDMEIGPDGAMYVLDYGKGFFTQNPEAGLYRIEFAPENKSPIAVATADPPSASEAPVTVTFDGSGSSDPEGEELTYEWDFDRDGEFDAEGVSAEYTFDEVGAFVTTLRVTDPQGKSTATTVTVTVGNEAPVLTLEYPADGGFFAWGDDVPYRYTATDAEDGDQIVCDRMRWIFGLGHDTHAHPLVTQSRQCEGVYDTPADAVEHGDTEKLYGVVVATYTDGGAQGVDPATTTLSTVLNVFNQEAEHANVIENGERQSDGTANAGAKIVFAEGGHLAYTPVNFTGIEGVSARAQGSGTVELRFDAADAEPFATATVTGDAWSDTDFTGADGEAIAFPTGTGTLHVTGSAGLQLDTLNFDGPGVTEVVTPEPEPVHIPVEKVAMGMYSLGPWTEDVGLEPVLERLAEIGYENVEPYGANLEPYAAEDFRTLTDGLGLSVLTSHYNTDEDTFDDTLAYVETLGQSWVGSGGFAEPGIGTLTETLATAETMDRLGARSVEAGVGKFFGHNHGSEFTTTYPAGDHAEEELSAWELLVERTEAENVTFQLDVAWAAHAGVDVVALLEEHGDRVELLHVKDAIDLGAADGPTFVNLGEGDVPLEAILAKAEEVGVELYTVEYDRAEDGESFATEGFEYITGLPAGGGEPEGPAVDGNVLGTSHAVMGPHSHEDMDHGSHEMAAAADDIGGTATLVKSATGTTVTVDATGLEPDSSQASHLHAGTCSTMGGHYKHDPSGSSAPPNEIWVSSDPADPRGNLVADADGNASGSGSAEWIARQEPLSVMIHENVLPGLPIACADFSAYDAPASLVLDADEGAESVEYSINGGDWADYTGPTDITEEGDYTVDFRATDADGVVGEAGQITFSVVEVEGGTDPVHIPAEQVSMGMYSLVNWVGQDGLVPVMDRLSTIGFENIEPFGGTLRGYAAADFRALADSYGFAIPTSHYSVEEATFADTLAYVKTLGQRYVGSGGFAAPGITSYEDVLATADTMDRLGALSVANGTGKFFGHNHDGEFTTTYEHEGETRSAWEILVMETDPELVTFQVDIAWAAHAGVDVVDLLAEHGERIDLLHVKDATNLGGTEEQPRPVFTNLGDGDVELEAILAKAQEVGVELYVMEYDGSPADDSFAAEGFEYLTGIEAGDPTPVPFTDVPIGTLFFEDISWLFENGISTGWETEDGREYRPLTPIARDAMAAFLYRQANSPEFTPPTVSPFSDVSTDNQFYKEIAWLHAEEISTGWANGDGTSSFRPLEPINRDAMAAFLYRMAEEPEFTAPTTSPFTDITPATQF